MRVQAAVVRVSILVVGAVLVSISAFGAVLEKSEVAAALRRYELRVSPEQVELLSQLPVTGSNPDLELESVDPVNSALVRARLRCRDRKQCLPFYVILHWTNREERDRELAGAHSYLTGLRSGPTVWLVRRGDAVNLVIQGPRSEIRMAVRCLESGMRGATIRARSMDHQRIYTATVVDSGLLKSRLGD